MQSAFSLIKLKICFSVYVGQNTQDRFAVLMHLRLIGKITKGQSESSVSFLLCRLISTYFAI